MAGFGSWGVDENGNPIIIDYPDMIPSEGGEKWMEKPSDRYNLVVRLDDGTTQRFHNVKFFPDLHFLAVWGPDGRILYYPYHRITEMIAQDCAYGEANDLPRGTAFADYKGDPKIIRDPFYK